MSHVHDKQCEQAARAILEGNSLSPEEKALVGEAIIAPVECLIEVGEKSGMITTLAKHGKRAHAMGGISLRTLLAANIQQGIVLAQMAPDLAARASDAYSKMVAADGDVKEYQADLAGAVEEIVKNTREAMAEINAVDGL